MTATRSRPAMRPSTSAGRVLRHPATRQTGLLFIAQISVLLLGLVTVPIVTRTLGPQAYGRYALVLATVTFLASFFEFGFFSAAARLLAQSADQEEEREILGSVGVAALLVAVAFGLVLWALSYVIDRLLGSQIGLVLRSVVLLAAFYPTQFMFQQIAQGTNRIANLAWLVLLPAVWMLGGVSLLAARHQLTLNSALIVNLTGLVATAIFSIFLFRPGRRSLTRRFGELAGETWRYGKDIYLGRVVGGAMFDLDKFLIARLVNTVSVGFYSLALIAVSPMATLSQSLSTSLFKDFASQDRIPRRVNVLNALWLIASATIVIVAGPTLVRLILSERYAPVGPFLAPLAIAAVFQGLYQTYNNFLGAHGQGRLLRNSALIFALVSVIVNYWFIHRFGAIGAAFATLISNLTYLSLCLYSYGIYRRALPPPATAAVRDDRYFESLYQQSPLDPWFNTDRVSQRRRLEKALTMLPPLASKRPKILDVGCGTGLLTERLADRFRATTLGLDISPTAIKRANETYRRPGLRFAVGALGAIDRRLGESFDVISCLEVLYYLDAPARQQALRQLGERLRPGGWLLTSVNIAPRPYFQLGELEQLVKTAGLTVVRVERYYNRLYFAAEQQLLKLLETPIQPLARWLLAQGWLFAFLGQLTKIGWGDRGVTEAVVLAQKPS